MKNDLLAEATRALRETDEPSELEVHAARARVMSGLHQTRVRRRTRLAFLLPIAATFLAASAWGAASGKAQRLLAGLEHWVGHPAATGAPTTPHAARATNASATSSVPASSPAQTPTEPAPASADVAPGVAVAPAPPSVSATLPSASSSSGIAKDPVLALYRVAHRAHFVDHDPARALAAWDAYLAAAPQGSFVPEARYNRALSLIRLGRTSEAQAALAPFADGSYGAYRRTEARALLEKLGQP